MIIYTNGYINSYNILFKSKECLKSKSICLIKLNLKSLKVKMEAQLI